MVKEMVLLNDMDDFDLFLYSVKHPKMFNILEFYFLLNITFLYLLHSLNTFIVTLIISYLYFLFNTLLNISIRYNIYITYIYLFNIRLILKPINFPEIG